MKSARGRWCGTGVDLDSGVFVAGTLEGPLLEHRRHNNGNTWHWQPGCSSWPEHSFIARHGRPYYGELCSECRARDRLANLPSHRIGTQEPADAGERR